MTDYDPRLWGKSGWTFIEYIALGYPDKPTEEDKKNYTDLFKSLQYTLPCKECRENYKLHLLQSPIEDYLKNSYSLYDWTILMQNKVNRILKKTFKNPEKERTNKFKRNISLKTGKTCCGRKTIEDLTNDISEEERKKNIENLHKKIRAKKSLLEKSIKMRKEKNRRSKNN